MAKGDFMIKDGILVKYIGESADVAIPEGTISIGPQAFAKDDDLFGWHYNEISIPDSVVSIGEECFQGCSIDLLNIGNGLKKIETNAFYYCQVKTVNYSGTIEQWSEIEYDSIFECPIYACGTLYVDSAPVVEAIISSKTNINELSLSYCNSIRNFIVDNNNPLYQSIDGNLYSKNGKRLIRYAPAKSEHSFTIPDSITTIDFGFRESNELTEITLGNGVKYIHPEAFSGCTSLKTINYSGTIDEWAEISYGSDTEYSSNNSLNLEHLYIGNQLVVDAAITTANKIGRYTFRNYSSLRSVIIGDSVSSIGEQAFQNCINLESVTISNKATKIEDDAFMYCKNLSINAPKGSYAEQYANEHDIRFIEKRN